MKQNVSPSPDTRIAIKAILIDLDGTLVHSAPEIARAGNQMLSALSLPALAAETIQSFIGEGAQTLIKRTLNTALSNPTDANLDETLLASAKTHFFGAYSLLAIDSKPFANVEAALNAFKEANLSLACVTNKPAQFTEPILKANGLLHYFEEVISGDTLSKKKPDPAQILHACDKFNIEPCETLLLGDSNTDVLAANNAGCYVFTVPYGYNQGLAIDTANVDATITDLYDTLNYIQL